MAQRSHDEEVTVVTPYVTEVAPIRRHLLVDGTTRIFQLLGEIDAKLEMAMEQAAKLRGMLDENDDAQSGTNNTLGAGA